MTTQELYEAQKQIGILARKVPEDGFDWGDDRPGIKEIVRNLCLIAVGCKLSVTWVRASLWLLPTITSGRCRPTTAGCWTPAPRSAGGSS